LDKLAFTTIQKLSDQIVNWRNIPITLKTFSNL